MSNRLKVLTAALGAVLVVGAIALGTALAQTATPGFGGMHAAVVSRAAVILGVSEGKLADALAQAHAQALDDAVGAGQVTHAQADWMKQRHQAMARGDHGPGMMGGQGMMGAGGMMAGHAPMMGGQPSVGDCLGAF